MASRAGLLCLTCLPFFASGFEESVPDWPLSKAVQVLNSSPWARQETYTRVIAGVGSGVSGEKEIFNTYYIRFVSAKPVRQALARIQQIQYGYEELPVEGRRRFDDYTRDQWLSNVEDWIVVAVSFRSNDPNEESAVRRFFLKETAETLKNKAFLSTGRFSQLRTAAYLPPRDESIGAKFVFPREIDGAPVVSESDRFITFELLDVPAASPRLRARFSVKDMVIDGKVIL